MVASTAGVAGDGVPDAAPSTRVSGCHREDRPIFRTLVAVLLGLAVVSGAFWLWQTFGPMRVAEYDPPILAGRVIQFPCSGGFYARHGDTIVLTSSAHCYGDEGTVATDRNGRTLGVFGPRARDATCPYPGHTCASSDIAYLVVAPDRIPWGHLNVVHLGAGGYRVLPPDTRPLGCDDIAIGDPLEVSGYGGHRTGVVAEKGENLNDSDGAYFPCMVAARVHVEVGDSGGSVLVRGIPAGVVSRSFGGSLGFTPLAEGLEQLGLDLCVTPDCGLVPPTAGG